MLLKQMVRQRITVQHNARMAIEPEQMARAPSDLMPRPHSHAPHGLRGRFRGHSMAAPHNITNQRPQCLLQPLPGLGTDERNVAPIGHAPVGRHGSHAAHAVAITGLHQLVGLVKHHVQRRN